MTVTAVSEAELSTPLTERVARLRDVLDELLTRHYLQLCGLGEAETGAPPNGDGQGFSETQMFRRESISSHVPLLPDRSKVTKVLLTELSDRDEYVLARPNSGLPTPDLVEVIALNDNGDLERLVAARVYQAEADSILIPRDRPIDEPTFLLLRDAPARERVRVLTKLVRALGYLIRFHSLRECLSGNSVRGLSLLIGLLGRQIGQDRDDDTSSGNQNGNNGRHDSSSQCGEAAATACDPSVEAGRLR